ncbi:MAG TPA: hydrophobic protein [Streptosporangiaceae bacterium]
MVLLIAVLLLALILGGLGFLVKALWIVALIVLVVWLLGFLFRAGGPAGGPRRRWYRW